MEISANQNSPFWSMASGRSRCGRRIYLRPVAGDRASFYTAHRLTRDQSQRHHDPAQLLIDEPDVVFRCLRSYSFGGSGETLKARMIVAQQLLGILMLKQLDAL